jgi:hypothetical protein
MFFSSPPKTILNSGPADVEFAVDNVTLGQAFL